ncbi:flippase-like domain-containing protein, partial [bacterium]|nr:flippase-like domain-containing protein [bacterium]
MKKKLLLWIVTIGVFVALFAAVDPAKAIQALSKARPLPLLAAVLLTFLFPVLSAIRWKWIMKRLDAHISLWDSLKLILAAWPLATVTPAKSGDLIKVLFLKGRLPYGQTAGLLLAERLIDVSVLSLGAAVGGFFLNIPLIIAVGVSIFLGVIAFFAVFSFGFARILPQKYQALGQDVVLALRRLFVNPI